MLRKAIVRKISYYKDSALKIIAPKAITAGVNLLRLGPRIIFRSAVELLRANLITRILSCITLLIVDVIDLARHRISKVQFVKNVILSALLVVSGTIGWNFGTRWIVLEFLGGFVDIAGGMIGAAILSFGSNIVLDKVCGKLIESDAQKMWKILDPHIDALPDEDRESIRDHVTCACLKKMYACEDKEQFAVELVDKLKAQEKVDGVLRAERHQ